MTVFTLDVEKTIKKSTAILRLVGVLNTETRQILMEAVDPLKESSEIREVIFNLDSLTHIDSRGQAALLSLHRYFTERDVSFRLVNVHDYVLRLFQVSNLVNLFEIGPAPEDEASLVHDRREALWRSHAFTTQLITALGEAVLGLDAEGRVLFANPSAEKLLGWDETELLGRSFTEAVNLRDLRGFPVHLKPSGPAGAEAGGHPVHRTDATLVTRDGQACEVEIVATAIYQYGDKIGQVLGIRDLTQRKQAQEELRRLFAAVEQAAEMIVVTDPEGVIQYVNPSFERTTGYSREEAVGQTFNLVKSGVHDQAFFSALWETIRAGKVWTGQFTNRRKDGSLYQEDATITPVQDSTGAITNYVAVKRDITQDILLEQQLRESQKFEAIAQLAGGVAHDFNNLLTSVIGNVQLARTRAKGDVQPYLQKAEQACMRGASLVQQLLLYSRKSPAEKEFLDINTIVREVAALSRETIDRRIEIVTDLGKDLPKVKADPAQMHQVLLNLILNARDAIQEIRNALDAAGETARAGNHLCRISITTCQESLDLAQVSTSLDAKPGEYVVLSVADTGAGMDAEVQRHLFEPFFTTKEVGKGTGLGLATVYGIVKGHNGWIEVQSLKGDGSTFRVHLPAAADFQTAGIETPGVLETRGGTETVLVVDDEDSICEVARDVLETHGYQVLVAHDGEEALAVYERESARIDLVLLDLSMPKLSGKEVMGRIRASHPEARMALTSGYLTEEFRETSGECVFIQKPFLVQDLLKGVRQALDNAPGK
jgi:anti-anti-sigma factor